VRALAGEQARGDQLAGGAVVLAGLAVAAVAMKGFGLAGSAPAAPTEVVEPGSEGSLVRLATAGRSPRRTLRVIPAVGTTDRYRMRLRSG
jgi:hypothetical protein